MTLINTGFGDDFKKLENQIREIGDTINDIENIILTHQINLQRGNEVAP